MQREGKGGEGEKEMDVCIKGKHGRISFSSSKCSFSFRVFFCS